MEIHKVEPKKNITVSESNSQIANRATVLRKNDEALISHEAHIQYHLERKHNLDAIQQRVNDGWYFRRNVILKVAQAMISANAI